MPILVGIDEAGFGPILGPLVISSCTFSLAHNLISTDLWHVLRKSVSRRRKALAGRLLITDSKKAYSKAIGIKHLQRTTLASLKCLGTKPEKLSELFAALTPETLDRLESYPWYKNAAQSDISINKDDVEIASNVFADDMKENGIKLLELKSCCLDVEHYNRLVNNVKNKASVLFTATSQLIMSAWKNFAEHELQIVIDRQGGRVHYRKNLQRMFPGTELTILKETPENSSYELRKGKKKMKLHFVVKADNKFLPVSLASMVSKYLRELLIARINHYFAIHCSELKPTAGYWKDGSRFINDLQTNFPHVKYDSNQLIRSR
jgi:ribonuclease HII